MTADAPTPRGLADTTLFVAAESGRPLDVDALPAILEVSVITIGELRAGVLAAADADTRDRRLLTLTDALSLEPHPINEAVVEAWAMLRIRLRGSNLRMGVNDSWIAATAMALSIPVVTQDEGYVEIAGLEVIRA